MAAIASSLLFLAGDEPVLVMTSGRHRVDTDHLARQLGAASVTMAPAKLVREITGQAIGGVSPSVTPRGCGPWSITLSRTTRSSGLRA